MTTYARVLDDLVIELFEMPPIMADRPIEELFHPDVGSWVDITEVDPQPEPGWSYDGTTFAPPPPIEAGDARVAWARRFGGRPDLPG